MLTKDRARGGRRAVLLVAIALACTGCRLSLTLDVDVDRNGGGTLGMAVAADPELVARAEQAGADPLGRLATTDLEGWRVRDTTADSGERTVTLSKTFGDPAELEELAAELTAALAAREVELLKGLHVELSDDQILIAGTAGAVPLQAVRQYGVTPRRAVRLLERSEALRYRVTVTPPGEVLEDNADDVTDGAQVWQVPPGQTVDFALTSTRPGPPILVPVLASVGVVAVALLGMRTVLLRRRRGARRRSAG